MIAERLGDSYATNCYSNGGSDCSGWQVSDWALLADPQSCAAALPTTGRVSPGVTMPTALQMTSDIFASKCQTSLQRNALLTYGFCHQGPCHLDAYCMVRRRLPR
jgi:hypothetical protein